GRKASCRRRRGRCRSGPPARRGCPSRRCLPAAAPSGPCRRSRRPCTGVVPSDSSDVGSRQGTTRRDVPGSRFPGYSSGWSPAPAVTYKPRPQRSPMPTDKRPPLTRRIRSGRYADERARRAPYVPYLAELQGPPEPSTEAGPNGRFTIATYNVHRWTGVRGGRAFAPEKTFAVIDELEAEVIALQEVLRPFEGPDPLAELAERLGYAVAFVCTRLHRRGELGNAVLARWPVSAAFAIDLTFGRLEQRSALAAQFR